MNKIAALIALALAMGVESKPAGADEPVLELQPGDKIVLIGNTLAERMQYPGFNHWENLLHSRFPKHHLVVRNLGWSGDTITTRLRSLNFANHGHTLIDHQPDVILAFFGFNESFSGPAGLEQFQADLVRFLRDLKQLKYPVQTFEFGSYKAVPADREGTPLHTPKIVLVSPIANEDIPERHIAAATDNNENIRLYTAAMKRVADQEQVGFVNLFTPTNAWWGGRPQSPPATINGCHLTQAGDTRLGQELDRALFHSQHPLGELLAAEASVGSKQTDAWRTYRALDAEVREKNLQFFYDYRAVNGYYIYGGRRQPFGVVNFPAEFAKLRKMISVRDERVWKAAQGETLSETIDDSGTGEFVDIKTNFRNEVRITAPEESAKMFTLADGFEINLWASEVEFPDLENPSQFAIDAQGRIWVVTMPSYPMYLPGTPVDDKVLILSDSNQDGQADTEVVFARGLHVPTGIELGDGGAYVGAQPNLMFLKDTDGDDQADVYEARLHGFDSADSHHSLHAFEWGPGGELYLHEGIFNHTHVETPHGLRTMANSGAFRYEPRSERFDVFVSYNFANPWGHCFDDWGQDFIADASSGNNYFAAPFSGDIDHPRKHPEMRTFLIKQWRPTCGCELVSSRNFPDEMQGDFLVNNCIGFQGILQYRPKETGSGFYADPISPLLRSSDPNFRPVDLQFGPDGALYVVDWFNPLIGHMQHSIRDPNRDKHHGRIWRISYSKKPLVEPSLIAGQPIPELLEVLQAYEYRTRYRARRELRDRPTQDVIPAVDKWVASLDSSDPLYERNLLEAIWVKQQQDVVDQELLHRLLAAQDGRARAAAVRVLCYWRDRVDDPLGLLRTAVNDEHPRVRLEAVRALSFFDSQEALEIAVESLVHDQDEYLEYCLKETLNTLQPRIEAKCSSSARVSASGGR